MRLIVLLMLVPLAGCLGDDPAPPTEDLDEAASPPPMAFDPSQPFSFRLEEHGCYAMSPALHVPRDHVQGFLPDGIVAETAEDLYARALWVHDEVQGLDDLAESPMSIIFLEAHTCRMHDGSMHSSGWLWVPIEAPLAWQGDLAPAGFDVYELCYAGYGHADHDPLGAARVALGFDSCGDSIDAGLPQQDTTGLSWEATAIAGGTDVWSVSMEHVSDVSYDVSGEYRIWKQVPTGLVRIDYNHMVGPDALSPVHYGIGFDCAMAPGSLPAQVAQATSCTEALQAGRAILPVFLDEHEMDVTFVYEPFENH